jgi:Predicted transcription factor, homolog of eukaryotic MBF1
MVNKETAIREAMRLNIISKRKALKMTQKDLAEYVGLKKNTVASWEQGLSSPDIDTIVVLLKLFDMNFYEFIGERS